MTLHRHLRTEDRAAVLAILSTVTLSLGAHAAPRSSADYAITAETVDYAGGRSASAGADYAHAGSLSWVSATSDAAAPVATVARHGYLGQLYDLLGYGLLASDYYPPELGTTQLFPVRTADDGTNVVISAAGFSFGVISGPLASVSATGLVTAGAVYQNTAAVVGASFAGLAGSLTLPLQVQDTMPDNFGVYAGDGLADAWQIQHFGADNPLAAPGLDPDGDGQTNRFEFTAGLIPTDPASVFRLRLEAVPGETGRKLLVFGPVFADRTYAVRAKAALTGAAWLPLALESSDGQLPERRVTDLQAAGAEKFYRLEITRP